FQRLGEYTIEPGKRYIDCRFPRVAARFVRLTVLAHTGGNGFFLGECEVHGPTSVFGHFGVLHQSDWRNDTIRQVSLRDELVSGRDRGDPNHWPVSESNGCWVGWREAGYTAAFVDTEDPENLGVTVYKRVGKGMIILETQELSYETNLPYSFWKANNLLDLPPNPIQKGPSHTCLNIPSAGAYLLSVQASDANAWASRSYSLNFRFFPASDSFEPNETPETAQRIATGIQETLYPFRDRDWWLFSLATPARYLYHLENLSLSLDPCLTVRAQAQDDQELAQFAGSCRHGFGGDESGSVIATAPGLYLAEVRHSFPRSRSTDGYRLSISEKPINQSFEPNDTVKLAGRIDSDVPRRASIFPGTDQDWYVLDMATGTLDLTVVSEAEDLDPQIRLYKPFVHKNGFISVLYLVGGMKSWHDFDQSLGTPFKVTRIEYDSPQARDV
ncbi:MAG TPA: hypothetical protein PKO06_23040, partial [Candidatus Ozemobacteraceae bacterium]|nr:hypothetical protein [Candidatus Ozemobacteraceae bacterium]